MSYPAKIDFDADERNQGHHFCIYFRVARKKYRGSSNLPYFFI